MNPTLQVLLYLSLIFGLACVLTQPTKSLLADRSYCGYQHTDDYLRPPITISIDEFPWMAQLLYNDELEILCGGFLINNRYVLTTAHCLKPIHHQLSFVRLGDYNVKSKTDCVEYRDETECSNPVEDFGIEEIIMHPNYNRRKHDNDIGLIRLSKVVQYSDFVRPICLPQKNSEPLKPGEVLVTSGWGILGMGLDFTDLKKRVTTILISNNECTKYYNDTLVTIDKNKLCAKENNSVTCQGDTGSPLMYSRKSQWEAVGIVAYGRACDSIYPTVYTNVIDYIDWIEETLRN